MFFVHVLKNLRDRAAERELIELVSGMTDGQVEDLGFGGLRDARRQAATEQRAAAAGWGPWYLRRAEAAGPSILAGQLSIMYR